jgi:hypothetical protein
MRNLKADRSGSALQMLAKPCRSSLTLGRQKLPVGDPRRPRTSIGIRRRLSLKDKSWEAFTNQWRANRAGLVHLVTQCSDARSSGARRAPVRIADSPNETLTDLI